MFLRRKAKVPTDQEVINGLEAQVASLKLELAAVQGAGAESEAGPGAPPEPPAPVEAVVPADTAESVQADNETPPVAPTVQVPADGTVEAEAPPEPVVDVVEDSAIKTLAKLAEVKPNESFVGHLKELVAKGVAVVENPQTIEEVLPVLVKLIEEVVTKV
jgi:hypothetical protein